MPPPPPPPPAAKSGGGNRRKASSSSPKSAKKNAPTQDESSNVIAVEQHVDVVQVPDPVPVHVPFFPTKILPAAVQQQMQPLDGENVILKLSLSGAGASYDPYDTTALGDASIFESRPCELMDMGSSCEPPEQQQTLEMQMQMNNASTMMMQSQPQQIGSHEQQHQHQQQQQQLQQQQQQQQQLQQQQQQHVEASAAGSTTTSHAAKVVRLLAEFEEKSKNGDWPLSTSVHCYWCCHRFDTPPLGLPIKFANGRFHVVGCFCSLECAAAYNFSAARESVDECLNRYSLINALSARLGQGRVVRPAPDRLALSIFGGHMSIDGFRAHGSGAHGTQRQVVVNCPPMQSVTQQVEEVSDADLSSEYRYIPIDTERVKRYQEKVRLMRTKPLVNFKNTLDHSMKLKYSSPAAAPPTTS